MPDEARRNEEQATERRASVLGIKYIDTSTLQKQIFVDVLSLPELYSLKIIPLLADEHHIHFGVTTTTSQQTLNNLTKRFTDQRIDFSLISESGYRDYMRLYDPPKQVKYQNISLSEDDSHEKSIVRQVSSTLDEVRSDDMLAYLVQQAYRLKASDIHLECQRNNTRVRFRVDGVLHAVAFIKPEKYRNLISSLATSANISTNEKNPQTGHISRSYKLATGEEIVLNLRVETIPTVYGMDAVLRIFNMRLEFFKLENLGLSQQEKDVVDTIIRHPTGMALIVGPTGSGKTTTLYSLINTLNTSERKIITLEDPVEYNLPGVVQIPVEGQLEGHEFTERLRAVLRLDPDVVMIGEIRDPDTAKTALQSSLTGHLVLSTFHADNAAAALTRMLDMVGINPLFTNAMRLIMAQRLVRRLDDSTKQAYKPNEDLKRQIQEIINSLPKDAQRPNLDEMILYRPGSSPQNPFGYNGQVAIREQMIMSPGLQQMLRSSPDQISTDALQRVAVSEGMKTLLQDGALKALAGLTTIEEVYRVIG